jgi:outer membrane lipoprotein-sorting protein
MTKRACLVVSLTSALLGIAPTAFAADSITAQQLLQMLAKNRASQADFVDRKYLSSLDRPLESSGELIYTAPSRLEKRTTKPKPETMIVDGDTLSIERNGTRRSISLSSYPEVAAFTESIRATLAGDLTALSRDYRVTVDGTQSQWRLTLLPSDQKIAAFVSRITINGRDDRMESFEVLQADGNRSVTTITPRAPSDKR